MKYMLLIHRGTTPLPGTPEWEGLSEAEQGAVYAAYRAINEDPQATSGVRMQPPETATTVRVSPIGRMPVARYALRSLGDESLPACTSGRQLSRRSQRRPQ
jgi:hypothetical protein